MKRPSTFWARTTIALLALAAIVVGSVTVWRASRALRQAAEDVRADHEFSFAVQPFVAAPNRGFEPVSSPQVFRQAARFQDHLYVAGSMRLQEYEPDGVLLHQYSVGIDLPSSPLIALAPALLADSHEAELVIATAQDGLLAFNGRSFRQILPSGADARAITAILPMASGHLLIGTKKRGVLAYDGKKLTLLHPMLDSVFVTAMVGDETDLWVGTMTRGVLHFHGGAVERFGETDGLPDAQVLSLDRSRDTTYVGTPTGVAVFDRGRFSRVLAPGFFCTALRATPTTLYVGSEDQGLMTIQLEGRHPSPGFSQQVEFTGVRQIFASGEDVLALAEGGLYRLAPHALGWQRILQASAATLANGNISALATDSAGRIWIGYFTRGLDILSAGNDRSRHVEDEHVFCVNRILAEPKRATVDVATANGLVRFDASGNEQQVLTKADGLIADHVTDVAEYGEGLALATPAGLTFLDAGGARSLYAFHGLVSNHVYALGVSGDELMAGTLGGLSELTRGNVSGNFTTSTSNLKHNWITAIVPLGSHWMIGTYGAGVLGLDASGKFHSFEMASGPVEINPNAMLVRPAYVLAGTLADGLYIYDRQSERWSAIRDGLPSLNVTAFAAANGFVYIGTDNGLVRIPEQKLHP